MQAIRNSIGMRTLKTAFAIFVCIFIYVILRVIDESTGLYESAAPTFRFSDWYNPFYASIATAYSMHATKKQSVSMAENRVVASFIGGIIGILLTVIYNLISKSCGFNGWPNLSSQEYRVVDYIVPYLLVAIFSILVIVVGNLLNKKPAIFVSVLTFLSITVNPMNMLVTRYGSMDYYGIFGETLFGLNRIASTVIGVLIALFINIYIHTPHSAKNNNILFAIGIEGIFYKEEDLVNSFSSYKVKRMTDSGAKLTLFTTRTPATFMHLVDSITINVPIICMSGAALYDSKEKKYLDLEKISYSDSVIIDKYLDSLNVVPFKNYIIDNVLYTYVKSIENIGAKLYAESKKNAPYCNFFIGDTPKEESPLYYLLVERVENVDNIINTIKNSELNDIVTIQIYDVFDNSRIVPELRYIKLYSKKILDLRIVKNYLEENKLKLAGISTAEISDYLFNISDYKISTINNADENIKYCKSYYDVLKQISTMYYSKKYQEKE